MKMSVQTLGMIMIFSLMIFIIPELLNFSIYYSYMNELSAYTIELIEVNEGINDIFLNKFAELQTDNPAFDIEYKPETINDNYKFYNVKVSYNLRLPILNYDYNLVSSKTSKRVIY